jgi:hypothetical protein
MIRAGMLFCLFALAALGQSPRTVLLLDGAPDEGQSHEGKLGALAVGERWFTRVAPGEQRFYGLTLEDLMGQAPDKLHAEAFLEGAKPVKFQWRVEDLEGRKNNDAAAWMDVELKPGLQRLELTLKGLKSRKGERGLDFTQGISRIRLSRRADQDAAAFAVGSVAFSGESATSNKTELQALEQLGTDSVLEDERRRLRSLLRRCSDTSVLGAIAQRANKSVPERDELLWILAANSTPSATQHVQRFLKDRKLPLTARVAIIRGLARSGRIHPSVAALAPAGSAWPLRAALLETALYSDCDAGMEQVIACTGKGESTRVQSVAVNALIRRLGTDLGQDTAAWKELWLARKNAPPAAGHGEPTRYGTFYGIGTDGGSLVFVLDGSGSMREPIGGGLASEHIKATPHLKSLELSTRLDLLKAELVHLLAKLPEGTRVGIVFFNDEALWLSNGLERLDASTRERLSSRIRAQTASQRTNVHAGLQLAFHPNKKPDPKDALEGPDTVFLLSDGAPSAGLITQVTQLCEAILRWNIGRMIRVHTINVGDRATPWMRRLSEKTGGAHQDWSSDKDRERGSK